MGFLLWMLIAFLGVVLILWTSGKAPGKWILVAGLLATVVVVGEVLSYSGIWQAVPAIILSLIWLIALWLVCKFGSPAAIRPYSGAFFALLLVVAIAPIYSAPVRDLPKTDGPYAVGMKEFVVTDTSRLGLRGEPADGPRKILVRAYYPSDDVTGLDPRPYMTAAEYQAIAWAVASLGQPGFMDSYKQHVATNTYENAPLSADRNFPVVVFSHGFTGTMAESLFIVENMVSRGHVVFMASHPGNTRAIVYPDGTTKLIDKSITEAMSAAFALMMSGEMPSYASLDEYWDAGGPYIMANSPMFTDAIDIWRDDMLAIADALFDGEIEDDIAAIWQATDPTKFAYVGMSIGGETATTSCHADIRCGLAISLDGDNVSPGLVNAQTRAPVVSIQAPLGEYPGASALIDLDIGGVNDLSFEPIAQAGLSGLVTRVIVADTKHLSFTDNATFWRGPVRPIFMVGELPADETNAAINGLVGAALDEHFRGKAGAVEAFAAANDNTSTYSLERVRDWARARGI